MEGSSPHKGMGLLFVYTHIGNENIDFAKGPK